MPVIMFKQLFKMTQLILLNCCSVLNLTLVTPLRTRTKHVRLDFEKFHHVTSQNEVRLQTPSHPVSSKTNTIVTKKRLHF